MSCTFPKFGKIQQKSRITTINYQSVLFPWAVVSETGFLSFLHSKVRRRYNFPFLYVNILLNIGLELDTRNVEQTKDVRMYIEEFILVDIWIHCCTKLK